MTEPIEPEGPSPAPDRMPYAGQSITACRALAAPVTVNRAARTVEVVWSTGARARNFVPPLGPIIEELDMRPEACPFFPSPNPPDRTRPPMPAFA